MSDVILTAPWIENTWYVACTTDELTDTPLGRQICGQRMVLYRGATGAPTALEDFCPHRGAPLSLGFLKDGALVCGYHGLIMGCEGQVSSMPGQRTERFPAIRAFPTLERFGFVWVWPGNPLLAVPAALPNLPWADDPDWVYAGGLYHVACDYRLMIDNLMDLTHETYVHGSSIGQKEIDTAPVETTAGPNGVVTRRVMDGVRAPPFWRMALVGAGLDPDAPVDRWQVCHFTLPSSVMIDVGVALAGMGGQNAPDAVKASSIVVDFMTPETETSHWYFWGMARKFAVDDHALTESIRQGQAKIFSEDLAMLERQQDNLVRNPDRRLLKLNIDAGGVRSRMLIAQALGSSGR